MMDKDTESINTVQLKPDYAASEVYSTVSGSEPPPVSSKSTSDLHLIIGVAGESPSCICRVLNPHLQCFLVPNVWLADVLKTQH